MANVKEFVNYIVKMNNDSFVKGSKENQKQNKQTEKSFGLTAKGAIALGTATIGAGAGLFKMADMASDLNEAMNVVTSVFGEAGDELIKWSETSIQAMGISQTEALKTAGVYGAMGTSLGLTDKEAMNMAMSLTQLSSDLSSFYNVSQEVAANSLKGIFTGETESLKQFGIMIDTTTLKQYGYRDSMSQSEKIMVRYKAVMDQTKDVQGDFARTSDGLANQTRILKEQFKQLATEIGQKLIPVITEIVSVLNNGLAIAIALVSGELNDEMSVAWEKFKTTLIGILPYLTLIAGVIVVMIGPMTILTSIVTTLTPIVSALGGAFIAVGEGIALLLSPMGLLILGIALLIGAIIQAGIQMGVWGEMLTAIGTMVLTVANFVKTLAVTIIGLIATFVGAILSNEVLQSALGVLASAIAFATTATAQLITIVVTQITKFIEWASQSAVVQKGLESLGNIIGFVIGVVTGLIGVVIQVIGQFIEWLNQSGLLQAALLLIESVIMAIVTAISIIITAISNLITSFTDWIAESGLVQTALDGIATAVSTISSAIEWMNTKIQEAIAWFANLAASAADAVSNIPVIGGFFDSPTPQGASAGTINNYYSFDVRPQDSGSYRSAYRSGMAMVQAQGRTL